MNDKQSIIRAIHTTNGTVKYLYQYPDGPLQGLIKGVDAEEEATLFTYEVALEISRQFKNNFWKYEVI